ncbi:MAG: 4Fe-4S dicluster domain-containing protein [Acidobacteriota bacterium]
MKTSEKFVLEMEGLDQLIHALKNQGHQVIGPILGDGAVILGEVTSAGDLPKGWTAQQDAGQYRLEKRSDEALFGYVVGPHSWRRFLQPPEVRLLEMERDATGFRVLNNPPSDRRPRAFLGVRACDLAAMAVQDRTLLHDRFVDPLYRDRRQNLVVVAVHCTQPARSCFCASMNTGPRAEGGYDLALTEITDNGRHWFLADVGSKAGMRLLEQIERREATESETAQVSTAVQQAATRMHRSLDTGGIRELLYDNLEHPEWDRVAGRCLSCANCTLVCPTCFCTTMEDVTDLTGNQAERRRRWDSCFALDFTYIHGGSVRPSVRARYRHWLVHKLASWMDQFGSSGCVGCGRCITWCPVGIDLTEEVGIIRSTTPKPAP